MDAFLGTGLLGSNFIRAMLRSGKQVHVWNRTEQKAKILETEGAVVFAKPEEAVKGAERIHLALSDDKAVDDTLELASAGFSTGVIIIDHTTTSAAGAAKRVKKWKDNGFTFIHAPVFMGPQNALERSGFMMVSCEEKLFKSVESDLSKMTGKLVYLGSKTDRAAGIKLLGNLFLISMTAGLSDTLALAKALDIPGSEVASLFEWFNPGAMTIARVKRILKADFDQPSWELNMARKDARLMMEEAQIGNTHLTVIPAIAEEMDRSIEKGFGKKDWTVIAKDNV
jgi:3-hydroxyisobutyrate dehydrogenase